MEADIAIVAISDRLENNFDAYRRLMGAGANVICHGTESYYPQGIDAKICDELDRLAKKNGVTFTGVGIWDMSRIWSGILVAGGCTHINSMVQTSITDVERVGKRLAQIVGVGMSQEDFAVNIGDCSPGAGLVSDLYKTIPIKFLTAIGYTVTSVEERREPVLFDAPIYSAVLERDIPPGECAGVRIVAEAETQEGVFAAANIELRVFQEGEVEHMKWRIEGRPSSTITVEREDSSYASAACVFNRIPDVIAAEPGVKVVSELGIPSTVR